MQQHTRDDRALLDALAALGGKRTTEDDIEIGGTKLRLPATMTPQHAVEFLSEYITAQEMTTRFVRSYRYRPQDVAVALMRGLKRVFGTTGIGRPTFSFFGSTPPERVTVPVGPGERDTVEVPAGQVEVPMLQGMLMVVPERDEELGILGRIVIDAPRKFGAEIEGLFTIVAEELRERSIYKGKPLTAQDTPQFLDVSGIDPSQVFYTAQVREQLTANLWAMMDQEQAHREEGLPLKRSVLLHGPYGTGKTLAATLTAQVAERNGWTFIVVRPGRDSIGHALTTAALYAPAIVFVEDIDVIADATDQDADGIAEVLDLFDGMGAKASEVCLVLTTNRPENIHRGLLRPGRLDALVEIGALDTDGVKAMIRGLVPVESMAKNVDIDAAAEAMAGMLPAFVREAIGRAQRYRIARGEKVLSTGDFIAAADGLKPQLAMFENGRDVSKRPTLDVALRSVVREEARSQVDGATFRDTSGEEYYKLIAPEESGA